MITLEWMAAMVGIAACMRLTPSNEWLSNGIVLFGLFVAALIAQPLFAALASDAETGAVSRLYAFVFVIIGVSCASAAFKDVVKMLRGPTRRASRDAGRRQPTRA